MKELFKKLKSLHWILGSVSVLVPGLSFFIKYSPPLFDQIAILVTALSAAFLWLGFKVNCTDLPRSAPIKYILAGFILAISYLLLLDMTSVRIISDTNDIRYQTGWGLAPWNLQDSAIESINSKNCPSANKEQLLYCYTVSKQSINLIWTNWSIYLFGIVNIALFTLSSVIWCYGWGLLINKDR